MKISIIIPSYNYGQYIEKAILSILSQNYPDKELIIIDGGSTDNTVNILKKYDGKIKWISEKDKGQADAINKGLWMSTGDIFAYLNADDYYEKNVFQDIAQIFSINREITLVYGKCRTTSPQKIVINAPQKTIVRKDLLRYGNITYQPATFFRADALKNEGGVGGYHYMMEYDMNLKALKHGKAYYLDKIMANFLQHPGQKSGSENEKAMAQETVRISRAHGGGYFSSLSIASFKDNIISSLKKIVRYR